MLRSKTTNKKTGKSIDAVRTKHDASRSYKR
jgi:hypothetical protein